MSRERHLVAGLDLGSTKTCAVIAEVVGDLPRVPLAKVLGVGLAKNSGVRRGMVRDIDETTRSVAAALRDAERMAGVKVSGVTCGIAGEHVSARTSAGVVAVNGEEITPQDVARVNEVARAISLGRDHELLHDIPQEYVVDQQRGISDPVGMTGTRLEVEVYLVTVQATAAQNLRRAVQRAGYRVSDVVLEPLAASYAVLTDDERELGVALLDVGGASTAVTIFHEGKIRHLASLRFAGMQVTTDLVQVLGVPQADAERLKERHGVAYKPLVDPSEMITLPSTPSEGRRRARCCRTSSTSGWTRSFTWWTASSRRRDSGAGGCPPAWCSRAGRRTSRGWWSSRATCSRCRCAPARPSRGSRAWWTAWTRRATQCRWVWCCTPRAGWRRAPRPAARS